MISVHSAHKGGHYAQPPWSAKLREGGSGLHQALLCCPMRDQTQSADILDSWTGWVCGKLPSALALHEAEGLWTRLQDTVSCRLCCSSARSLTMSGRQKQLWPDAPLHVSCCVARGCEQPSCLCLSVSRH